MNNQGGFRRGSREGLASSVSAPIVTPQTSNSPHMQNNRNTCAVNDRPGWARKPSAAEESTGVSSKNTGLDALHVDVITTPFIPKTPMTSGPQSNRTSRDPSHASEGPQSAATTPQLQKQQNQLPYRLTAIPPPRKRSSSVKRDTAQPVATPLQINHQTVNGRENAGMQIVFESGIEIPPSLESVAVPLQYTFAVPSQGVSRAISPSISPQSYSLHPPMSAAEEAKFSAVPTTRPVSHSESRKHTSVDNENDLAHPLPFLVTQETFAVPGHSPDDVRVEGEGPLLWKPGQPLRIAYITWNMAAKEAISSQVSAFCVQPNAHIIAICTQENGSLTTVTGRHNKWEDILSDRCLNGQYDMLESKSMWSIHLAVFARSRDVARYVVNVHDGSVSTGIIGGMGGNKGGIGIGLALRMLPNEKEAAMPASPFDPLPGGYRAGTISRPSTPAAERGLYPTRALLDELDKKPEQPTAFSVSPPAALENPLGSTMLLSDTQTSLLRDVSATFSTEQEASRRSIFTPIAPPRRVSIRRVEQQRIHGEETHVPPSLSVSPARSPAFAAMAAPLYTGKVIESAPPSMTDKEGGEASVLSDDVERNANATYLTILFVGAHLAAHQEAVELRNQDYQAIIRRLPVGIRGPYRSFFLKHLMHNGGLQHCRVSGKNAQRVMTWIKRNRARKASRLESQNKATAPKPERSSSAAPPAAASRSPPVAASPSAAAKSTVTPLMSYEIYGVSKPPRKTLSKVEESHTSEIPHSASGPTRAAHSYSTRSGIPRASAGVRTSKGQSVVNGGGPSSIHKPRKGTGNLRISTSWSSDTSDASSGSNNSFSSSDSDDDDDDDSTTSTSSSDSINFGDDILVNVEKPPAPRSKTKREPSAGPPSSPFIQSTSVLPALNPTGKKGMVKDSLKEVSKLRSSIEAALRNKAAEGEKQREKQAKRALKRRMFPKVKRDVTNEFDITFFGGDLNYRIKGTRQGIEKIVNDHVNLRSVLMANDQLNSEKAKGNTLQGFREANLLFRPTYKYEVKDGVTQDIYNIGSKKAKMRLPAYCDRILYKQPAWARRAVGLNSIMPLHESGTFTPMRGFSTPAAGKSSLNASQSLSMTTASPLIPCTSGGAGNIEVRLYTDVPDVRTSDHRPVVALFDFDTFIATFNTRAPNTPLRNVKHHEKRQKRPTTAQISFQNEK